MCIICAKAKGIKRPTDEQFEAMMESNPHGFGMATFENGRIVVRKTMLPEQYMKWVKKVKDETPAIFHMRIATHGSVSEKNCHPFISDDGQWAFAHNGILSIKNEGDMTDSETFFRRMALPLLNGGFLPHAADGAFDHMVDAIIGGSKFAFMDNTGAIMTYGPWIEDNGLLFSNTSYRPITFGFSKYYPTEGGKNINSIGSGDYNELLEMICDDLMYGGTLVQDEEKMYQVYKRTYPRLKHKVFKAALDEALIWTEDYRDDWEPTDPCTIGETYNQLVKGIEK